MGIIKRGILGGFSGRIGNVVGSSWKGLAVVKSLPLSVANPRTTAQTTQRSKFANCVAFASMLLTEIIKPLWDRNAVHMSGFNAFCQANIDLTPSGVDPDYENLVISQGALGTIPDQDFTYDPLGSEITITWDGTPSGSYQAANDQIVGFAYVPAEDLILFVSAGVERADETLTISVPTALGETPTIYWAISALSADGFKAGSELCKKVG